MLGIKHVQLSEKEQEHYLSIMVKGNTLLRHWANVFGCSRTSFRKALLNNTLRIHECGISENQIDLFYADLPDILVVQTAIEPILASHIKSIAKLSRKWAKYNKNIILDYDDFFMEGYMAAIETIWGYSNPGIKYLTYLYKSITNCFKNLVKKFNTLNQAKTINLSELSSIIEDPKENELESRDEREVFEVVLSKASLTDIERAVVLASQDGKHGWRAEIARNYVNPSTKKPYTRAAVKLILKRALVKLNPLIAA